jgi:hypothetical protein
LEEFELLAGFDAIEYWLPHPDIAKRNPATKRNQIGLCMFAS